MTKYQIVATLDNTTIISNRGIDARKYKMANEHEHAVRESNRRHKQNIITFVAGAGSRSVVLEESTLYLIH